MTGRTEPGTPGGATVSAWRITHADFADDPFNGAGAAEAGGRFNSPGRPVVYAAGSLALAMLEVLVHLDEAAAPGEFVACRLMVEERSVTDLTADLPAGWAGDPDLSRGVGDRWLASGRSAAAWVPSAVLPFDAAETGERNLMLDPAHADFPEVILGPPRPFRFDARLADFRPTGD